MKFLASQNLKWILLSVFKEIISRGFCPIHTWLDVSFFVFPYFWFIVFRLTIENCLVFYSASLEFRRWVLISGIKIEFTKTKHGNLKILFCLSCEHKFVFHASKTDMIVKRNVCRGWPEKTMCDHKIGEILLSFNIFSHTKNKKYSKQ